MTLKKNSKLNDQPLSWSEAVRKRPGLYIGSANNKGLVYIIKKIIFGIFSHAKSDFVYLTLHDKSKVELKFHHCQNPINDNCYINSLITTGYWFVAHGSWLGVHSRHAPGGACLPAPPSVPRSQD